MDLLTLKLTDRFGLDLEASPWLIGAAIIIALVLGWRWWKIRRQFSFETVEIEIALGNVGKIKLKPSTEDLDVAHKIWTELVTRKAALPFDPEHDVIVEIYDSWHALFPRIRQLISDIPGRLVRRQSTKELIRVATVTLNDGLRPHLTRWQARFRNWYAQQTEELTKSSPQDVQKKFPEYTALIADLIQVNQLMVQYANELKKLVHEPEV